MTLVEAVFAPRGEAPEVLPLEREDELPLPLKTDLNQAFGPDFFLSSAISDSNLLWSLIGAIFWSFLNL